MKSNAEALPFGLIADVGGTNTRFATIDEHGAMSRTRVQATDDHGSLAAAIRAYIGDLGLAAAPRHAALAVASPVIGDSVTFTNHPWSFRISELREAFAFERLEVVNDFTANALALPHLKLADRFAVGGGEGVEDAPRGVLGPGTGLGASGLIRTRTRWVPLPGEGGHVTMAPADGRESEVLSRMRRRFGHVSAERVLSGQGLVNLYGALAEIAGVPAEQYSPPQITDRRLREREPLCQEAFEMFCGMLGTVAGNLALTWGARGGIYIAGGIVPRLGADFAATSFRSRFEDKGRFRAYLEAIPTFVVTNPVPAFLGLAALLRGEG